MVDNNEHTTMGVNSKKDQEFNPFEGSYRHGPEPLKNFDEWVVENVFGKDSPSTKDLSDYSGNYTDDRVLDHKDLLRAVPENPPLVEQDLVDFEMAKDEELRNLDIPVTDEEDSVKSYFEDQKPTSSFEFTEIQVSKLNLQPGEILAVTIKSDEIDEYTINSIKKSMKKPFPNNEVLIFGVGRDDSVIFSKISREEPVSSCSTGNFCSDCNCGKKEQFQGVSK